MTATTLAADTSTAAAPASVVIKCIGLTKIFRDFWWRNRVRAVDGIDLNVRRGEVFGLLGPNGSGKSTTIKLILGLLQPTAGRIAVFGKRADDVATKKRIGFLPEESYLYPFLNARETLDYYGRLFHQSRHQRLKRIDMLLEMVGLEAVQRRPIREYSKGMQRRIGLAQALINDPQLLMLDEPTNGMDPIGTRQIKNLILELARHGKTILLCSHLLADVEDVCDRVAIMYGGKIVEHGGLDQLLTQTHTTTIQSPRLDEKTIQQIENVLARQGKHIEKVTQPRQSLEHKFLDLVKREQARGAATSGAVSGGGIARFLTDRDGKAAARTGVGVFGDTEVGVRGAHLPESTDAAEVINRLVGEASAEPEPAPLPDRPPLPAEPPPAEEQPAQPDAKLIDGLVESSPSPAAATAGPSPADEPKSEPQTTASAASGSQSPPDEEEPDQDLIDSLIDQGRDDSSRRDRSSE
ncbi:MAG: ABC transporter ATP-binding protein [Phycisphaeraceae bacterium]